MSAPETLPSLKPGVDQESKAHGKQDKATNGDAANSDVAHLDFAPPYWGDDVNGWRVLGRVTRGFQALRVALGPLA